MPCDPCKIIACSNPVDYETYSLQSGRVYNSGQLSAVVGCPDGYSCSPGIFPHTFVYDGDDTPVIVIPDPIYTYGGQIGIQGCQSPIVRTLPANATPTQINIIVNEMWQEWAEQQAECDAVDLPGVEPKRLPAFTMTDLDPVEWCINAPYSAEVSTNNANTTFSIAGTLPTGLTLTQDGNTATISGTPTVAGIYPFAIVAQSGADTVSKAYNFLVASITTASPLPDADVGTPYSETIAQFGISGTVTWTIASGSLPDGLALNPATGEISGTPTLDGLFTFTIQASNE